MAARDLTLDQALPDNLDAERFILGAIMSSESAYLQVAGALSAEDFSLEKHKRIFLRMSDLHERGDKIDRVTLANELMKQGQLQSVDGLSYLVSLDDGLPQLFNLESYVGIVKEKALLRRIISVSQDAINRCLTAEGEAQQILGAVEDALIKLGDSTSNSTLLNPAQIITEYEGGINAFLDTSKRLKGISTGFLKFDELTGGLREGDLFILAARPAMGKAQPLHAPVKTLCGWKPIGELALGDSIASVDGEPSVVTGVFPQGKKKIYKITFSDGRSTECCGEHLWKVQYRHWDGGNRTITTEKIAELLTKQRYQSRLSIPLTSGEFGAQEPPLSPWLLGYLIGDGSFCRGQLSVTAADREIIDRLKTELAAYNCKLTPQSDIDYRISMIEKPAPPTPYVGGEQRRRLTVAEREELCQEHESNVSIAALGTEFSARNYRVVNPFVNLLQSLGLYGLPSQEKFIPTCYFETSRETRLELLRGLMDSDGTAEKFGAVTFSTSSERLARDVQYLVRSIGGISRIAKRSKGFTYRGEKKLGLPANIVSVVMNDPSDAFWLERKKCRAVRATKNRPRLRIVSVEPVGDAEAVCISVSHPSRLYITNDFIVTHNTALALNIAQHVATSSANAKAVAVFSLEMSKESLLTRMLCASARVDQQRFRAGYLSADERRLLQEAMYRIVEAPLYLDDTAGTNLMEVHSKLRRLQAEQDLGLVVIDYLQLMQGRGRFENRVQEISSLSRGLKLMSKELRVPFLVLSQLSRAPESRPGDHRPMLSDLRESGSIEQDADMVGFIFREEVYRPDKESLKGMAELILAKQRNGPTGRVKLAFLNRFTKFENLATDTGDDEPPFNE